MSLELRFFVACLFSVRPILQSLKGGQLQSQVNIGDAKDSRMNDVLLHHRACCTVIHPDK